MGFLLALVFIIGLCLFGTLWICWQLLKGLCWVVFVVLATVVATVRERRST